MDYFKHYSTASRSNLLNHLLEEMGPSGYAYWFLMLELCAECWDGEGEPRFRFHARILRQKLRISQTKLELFLGFCQGFGSLSFCFSEKWIDLEIPKLAEVKTSRKLIKSNKNLVSVDKEIDTDKEIDKEDEVPKKNLPKAKPKAKPKTPLFEVEPTQLDEELSINQTASNALTLLNALTFSAFRPVPSNMKFINARLNEGYSLEDFKLVIEFKQRQWASDPKMKGYLRPETLFGTKFDGYLQESQNAAKPIVDPLDAFFEQYAPKLNEGA